MIKALRFVVHEFEDGITGKFDWGPDREDIFETFDEVTEEIDPDDLEEIIEELEDIIDLDPQFIDAFTQLSYFEFNFGNYGNAKHGFTLGVKIGNDIIPKNFAGRILWGMIENRPFLRAMCGLGLSHFHSAEYEEALQIFEKLLVYNPDDKQGCRVMVVQCNIILGRFNEVLKICDTYHSDTMVDVLYGKVLAYYKLRETQKAKETLEFVADLRPLVVQELLKKRHTKVVGDDPDRLVYGGADEAYDYWKRMGGYWTDPDLVDLLKACAPPQETAPAKSSKSKGSQKLRLV